MAVSEFNFRSVGAVETRSGRFQRGDETRDSLVPRAVARAKEGDQDALRFLYVRYADDVCGYVQSIVKDHHEAEDVTQNVFVKLTRIIGKYEPRGVPFSAWLLRVARNAALDHLRARRLVPCEQVRISDNGQEHIGFERAQTIKAALEEVPPEQREVLMLRHVAGLTPAEIAERLDKTEASVHGLHHRGRRAIQGILTELEALPATAGG